MPRHSFLTRRASKGKPSVGGFAHSLVLRVTALPAEGFGVRWFARIRETLSWMKFYLLERGLGYGA